ncbi:MAG: L,D-transpeptidase family protein [Victivallales bacterium]|nr:L,D-transpeptidase family protein [Victivallales bacterium]
MNPYFKYPLIGLLVFIVLLVLVVRGCGGKDKVPEPSTSTSVTEGPGGPAVVSQPVTAPPATTVQPPSVSTSPSVQPSSVASPEVEKMLESAREQLNRGMLEAARQIARNVLKMPEVVEFDKTWRRAAEIIDAADKRLMNSTAPTSEKKKYVVVKNDNLTFIARRNFTSIGALKRINENLRHNTVIRPSQTIMFISGKWSIRVSKQHFLLMLYLNDELYRIYTVGIGRDNRTPAGTFLITGLTEEPAWYRNDGQVIPYGDAENLLGTRWMKLTPTEGTDPTLEGYGIHGTWEPDSCGTSCSAGCVRMRNEEVEELFDFIPPPRDRTPPVRVVIEE